MKVEEFKEKLEDALYDLLKRSNVRTILKIKNAPVAIVFIKHRYPPYHCLRSHLSLPTPLHP